MDHASEAEKLLQKGQDMDQSEIQRAKIHAIMAVAEQIGLLRGDLAILGRDRQSAFRRVELKPPL